MPLVRTHTPLIGGVCSTNGLNVQFTKGSRSLVQRFKICTFYYVCTEAPFEVLKVTKQAQFKQ